MYVYMQLYVYHYYVNVCRDVRHIVPCSCELWRKSATAVCAEWTELAKTRFSRGPVNSTCMSICEMRTAHLPYNCMYTHINVWTGFQCEVRQNAPWSRSLQGKLTVCMWSVMGRRALRSGAPKMTGQHGRWKMDVRHSLVTFGAPDLRARARRADHAERIHFFHRLREQGAFCRNRMIGCMGQKACRVLDQVPDYTQCTLLPVSSYE